MIALLLGILIWLRLSFLTGAELALHGDDERALARLMARARIISNMPGLKKDLQGNADAVAAVMISLEGYGLPTTAQGINDAFDWIEGKATLTAQTYQALARKNGYDIIPVVRTAEKAVARIERPGRPPIEVEYTLEDAKLSGRLDEWVERWVSYTKDNGNKGNRLERFVIGAAGRRRRTVLDGEEIPVEFPEWVTQKIRAGEIKRFDAWWKYRADMLWKSAAKRAVKIAAPHVLLGVAEDDQHDSVWDPDRVADKVTVIDVDETYDVEIVDVTNAEHTADDETGEIYDAEIVEDPAPAPRPAPVPPRAQATATDTGSAADDGERRAPAGEQQAAQVPRPARPERGDDTGPNGAAPHRTSADQDRRQDPVPAEEPLWGPQEEPFT